MGASTGAFTFLMKRGSQADSLTWWIPRSSSPITCSLASLCAIMRTLARSILTASQRFTGISRATTASPARNAYLTCASAQSLLTQKPALLLLVAWGQSMAWHNDELLCSQRRADTGRSGGSPYQGHTLWHASAQNMGGFRQKTASHASVSCIHLKPVAGRHTSAINLCSTNKHGLLTRSSVI